MIKELRWLTPREEDPTMKATLEWRSHITKSCLGLGITAQRCSSVANNNSTSQQTSGGKLPN